MCVCVWGRSINYAARVKTTHAAGRTDGRTDEQIQMKESLTSLPSVNFSPFDEPLSPRFEFTVNTTSLPFTEPRTVVAGERELYVNSGSSLNVTCVVVSPDPPAYVFWKRNGKVSERDSRFGH